MITIGIFGATGRVGKLLIEEILSHKKCQLASVYVRNELQYNIPSSTLVTSDMSSFIESNEVIIDFSSPEATQLLLESVLDSSADSQDIPALVIGTTGLTPTQKKLLRKASNKTPILYATNMSYGIAVLEKIVALLSRELRDFDIEIIETHHKYKKDSPSGTAHTLAESALKARNLNEKYLKFNREGLALRKKDEIGMLSLRGGDVVGKHTVGFYGEGEYLELTHNATSRVTFAKGALSAALWLVDKKCGLYNMRDRFEIAHSE
ncbi:4-hydroxy-tetrahydrodipicolinate reductase [Helicobacter sp. MIT 14-3879]|uniref:4-hydroxy-tetrahydrodipicolinate reductase n=1 Tax=Helicobacter sp. MIT 14-3879 TaxID=2040649 RepID=UPI000E1EC460|nr:4-hydroxy-tetrahydrodipicolinate reductase [Helicobacter sp. MIT 14-3879]RDU61331.1 4-hydroxy-tetrahydrodipicolinate reductase [Helicobacter sp. MIT 14-3879]